MLGALSWSFEEADSHRVDALLEALLAESGAERALLIDRTGQLIAAAGSSASLDPTTFASLAAADFAANEQLAALLGEPGFASLYHQGARNSLFLAGVAGRAILAVVFPRSVALGMVRLKMKTTVDELARLVERMFTRQPATPAPGNPLLGDVDDEIDRLFQ